jgi:hypothetical protein
MGLTVDEAWQDESLSRIIAPGRVRLVAGADRSDRLALNSHPCVGQQALGGDDVPADQQII